MNKPGRFCPLHYRYDPAVFARAAELNADTLFIAGGLYGNESALDALQRLLEPQATLVFNGDFNWFNVDAEWFANLNKEVLQHVALRGNVETELGNVDGGAGCGCNYPESVDDSEVERAEAIMARLRQVAAHFPELRARLAALPMHLVAQVGDLRVAIVHGDAHSLAGWDFAHDQLHQAPDATLVNELFTQAGVDVFASSHTCLPALRTLRHSNREYAVINNGAAGMPNFSGSRFGIATRISIHPCPPTIRLYGSRIGRVFVDAVTVHYDHRAFVDHFLSNWPAGSAAHQSYYSRITNGPVFTPEMARGALAHHSIRQLGH